MKTATQIKKGESVRVYVDPLSEQKLEGEFIPYKRHKVTKVTYAGLLFHLEVWSGHFYGDECSVLRTIKVVEGGA